MNDKELWILGYIDSSNYKSINMLDENFVKEYILKFNPKHEITYIGAYKCKELSRFLSDLYKSGYLLRRVVGLNGGSWQQGFPKWIYDYYMV